MFQISVIAECIHCCIHVLKLLQTPPLALPKQNKSPSSGSLLRLVISRSFELFNSKFAIGFPFYSCSFYSACNSNGCSREFYLKWASHEFGSDCKLFKCLWRLRSDLHKNNGIDSLRRVKTYRILR